ncbi:Transcriptional regulator, AbiEi antitoxin, Type IV TA system [Lachnospiraceae bacterium XBB1006]|nr:Transcriptional regulator, AbiEi antitoxin, Type IV TA system [Lachnospiraceae bacterium XBB1006]
MDEKLALIEKNMKQCGGIMKTSQLYELCQLDYRSLNLLLRHGYLERVKNGYYKIREEEQSEEAYITSLFPDGVLCMESALYQYGYLRQKPFAWSIAINKNTSKSRFLLEYPVVVPYYTEPRVLEIGVTTTQLDGKEMKIYDRDRVICDVLKYEHKMERNDFKMAIVRYLADGDKDYHRLLEYAKERKVSAKVQNVIGVWL